jgi:hypothetical protein
MDYALADSFNKLLGANDRAKQMTIVKQIPALSTSYAQSPISGNIFISVFISFYDELKMQTNAKLSTIS